MKPLFYIFLGITLIMLNVSEAETRNADYSNINSGTLLLDDQKFLSDAIVLNSKVKMHISGPIADVVLVQSFQNTSTAWVEGTYVFPLPENASVRSMKIQVGERSIEGAIFERRIATKNYQQARQSGKLASVVNMQRNNLFTTKISNIAPGEIISIELDYFQTLQQSGEEYNWQMPTTYTPRYNPADLMGMAFNNSEEESTRPSFEVQIILDSKLPLAEIQSKSHEIDVIRLDDKYLISLQAGSVHMDRDFLLHWKDIDTGLPLLQAHEQKKEGERYALFVIKPPAPHYIETQPREVIFVLDISGSMAGNSIRAAKTALRKALDKLKPKDRFNIIVFNDRSHKLYQQPQQAYPELINKAKTYLDGLYADGGTEIHEAISLALSQQNTELLRQIVLITDGSVGNETQILKLLHNNLDQARLFTIGIGSAPNSFFMHKAAQMGRGNSRFIVDDNSVESEISALFDQLSLPVLTSINVQTDAHKPNFLPNPVPDLYSGQPLHILAKLAADDKSLTITGLIGDQPWKQSINLSDLSVGSTAISSLWAREKIEQIMDKQWIEGDSSERRQEVIDLSIAHSVLSAYTSFLAIDSTPVRDLLSTLQQEHVKSLLPAGSGMINIDLPQGATSAGIWLAFGLLILIINTIIRLKVISWSVNREV